MSRYIDADALIEKCYKQMDELMESTSEHLSAEALSLLCGFTLINSAPSIDIVRCKECRHWIGETEYYEDREYKACWQLCGQYMNSEFWCKYGEREGE